ncbi:response regulator transcription factor [Acidiphilium iwatense]|uniref:Response regulator transcription factor n=1 Tax=Acidiphilium iwatense TaxID=768198 RepID=A0ABS9DXT5_9PROT|nr:response regulator transcription factor [Acidiphilium iwatense]MCF3947556.1 response regulator transcription factor [Acidiphilium iwatense]
MPDARPILIVTADNDLRIALTEKLSVENNFSPQIVSNIADAEAALADRDRCLDTVILDFDNPKLNGLTFSSEIRRQGKKMPMIIVSTSPDEKDVVRGLKSGADDYIVKPLRMDELLARLRAHLRNFERSEAVTLRIGPYTFHPAKKSLINPKRNKRILLTDKETALLKCLCRAGGQPVSRAALKNEIWGLTEGDTHCFDLSQ